MEDFSIKRPTQDTELTNFQTEWLENQGSKAQGLNAERKMLGSANADSGPIGNSTLEIAFLTIVSDKGNKNSDRKSEGPGKDVADRLDRELREFADSKIDSPTSEMKEFQKLISKFCDEPDKKKGLEEMTDPWLKLRVQLGNKIEETYNEKEAEGAAQPGRKALEKDFEEKVDSFFKKVEKLPPEEEYKIYSLLEWRDGESRQQRSERVREGLKGNKGLLDSFNTVQESLDKIEANKSAREKELEALHKVQLRDYHLMPRIVEKAYIRSEIKY